MAGGWTTSNYQPNLDKPYLTRQTRLPLLPFVMQRFWELHIQKIKKSPTPADPTTSGRLPLLVLIVKKILTTWKEANKKNRSMLSIEILANSRLGKITVSDFHYAMLCNAILCYAMLYHIQYDTQYTIHYAQNTIHYAQNTTHHTPYTIHNTTQYNTIQHNTIQCKTIQHNTIQHFIV